MNYEDDGSEKMGSVLVFQEIAGISELILLFPKGPNENILAGKKRI